MNFFNSIFSEDLELSDSSESPPNDPADNDLENPDSENPNPVPESSRDGAPASAWNFGSLIKTITTQSESVIGNYRRDFEEFGSGLLKETALIRDVASRAVKEFPDSIDAGASVAQESLESVGQAIDNLGSSVWQGTNKILARGKELHLFDDTTEADDDSINGGGSVGGQLSASVTKYSWFDTKMREIQADARTYTEDPDDLEDYKKWKSGFLLDEKGEAIVKLTAQERLVERIYLQLVPVTVDKESFWNRYFYKVEKLQQAEEARARVVKRAISGDDEEDLSWDVDDEGVDEGNAAAVNVSAESSKQEDESCGEITEVGRVSDASEGKVSGEKNDIISRQPSFPGVEELEWDEIDDVGSSDDNKATTGNSSNVSDLRKRLSAADEEEDLSWDIEDDDEPVKS